MDLIRARHQIISVPASQQGIDLSGERCPVMPLIREGDIGEAVNSARRAAGRPYLVVLVVLALWLPGCGAGGAPALSDLELSATETASAPTPPPAPAAPTALSGKRVCRGDFRGGNLIWVEDVDLAWQDNASSETGYVIYKDRVPLDVLPADSTKYHLQFRYNQGVAAAPHDTFAV